VSAIRRPAHPGQKPRPLHEKATTASRLQAGQRTRTKPWARMPHSRKNARKFEGKALTLAGTTTAERAASLLDGFKAAGLAEEIA